MTYDEDVLHWVARYAAVGWPILILPHGAKSPQRKKGWQHARPTPDDFAAALAAGPVNVGCLCGEPANGLLRVDPDTPWMARACEVGLPSTPCRMTRTGSPCAIGYFYLVQGQLDGPLTIKDPTAKGDEATVVDLIWTGRQTVLPPSVHPDGSSYLWSTFGPPAQVAADVITRRVRWVAAAALTAAHWPDGGRHDAMLAVAGGLLNAGWTTERVEEWVLVMLHAAQDDEVEDRVRAAYDTADRIALGKDAVGFTRLGEMVDPRVIRRVSDLLGVTENRQATRTTQQGELRTTDLGNAERLRERFGSDLLYCAPMKKWLTWTGSVWAEDDRNRVGAKAIEIARSLYEEAAAADTKDKRQLLASWAVETESANRLASMVTVARAIPELTVVPAELDVDAWVLNTPRGTVDLRTGKVADNDPGDRLTMATGVPLGDPGACPRWVTFLGEILPSQDLVAYLQRWCGYLLTGLVNEEVLLILWGLGGNGKSKLLATLRHVLGSYAASTPFDTFDADARRGSPGNDLAALRGRRLVTAIEADEERSLAEARVKAITGGDPVTCRYLYGEYFTYTPTYKLMLATNRKPRIRGTDHAIWRRIHFIPFTRRFEGSDRDLDLEAKLRAEGPGVLAWMLGGLRSYLEVGLAPPASILEATAEYRDDMDVVGNFLQACTRTGDQGLEASSRDLYVRYKYWAEDLGERALSHHSLSLRMVEHGFSKRKSNGQVWWRGLELLPEKFLPAPLVNGAGTH